MCGGLERRRGSLGSELLRVLMGSRWAERVGSKSDDVGGLNSGRTGVGIRLLYNDSSALINTTCMYVCVHGC